MSYTVVIHGPNVGQGGEFHVHKPHCADLAKRTYWYCEPPWTTEVESVQELVELIFSDIIDENDGEWASWEAYASDVKVFPCVKGLR